MSELYIIRHAQASFGADDYDRLSELGHKQAECLGTWLAARGPLNFDKVLCGAMTRHRETLQAIERAYAACGRHLPTAEVDARLNEFDHHSVLRAYAQRFPDHAAVREADNGRSRDVQAVYRFLRTGLQNWAAGRLDDAVAEPWSTFQARVRQGRDRLLADASNGARVLVMTSGGVIAQIAQAALDVPDQRAVDLNLTIRNSAICEFFRGDGELRLASWNSLPHLAQADLHTLWTYY